MKLYEITDNKIEGTCTLYHYSTEKYDILKTRSKQGITDTKDINQTNKLISKILKFGNYNDHISLYFEKAPLDMLGTIYKGVDHDIWYTGSKLYEYEINLDDIGAFVYNMVETPLEIKMFYDDKYDNMSMEAYVKMLYKLKIKSGLCGDDRSNFIKQVNNLKGTIVDEYIKLPSRPNWEDINQLYAPTVPHVMLYPDSGVIKYRSVKSVVVGDKPLP
jgi:hypothetical protein